ncbi:MAG TPA: asparagine synthase-related protein, partial [Ktedonobacterales bacterium]|nr:asparagine synthase-related protein [Ktedonobacterales bacterium]
VDRWLRGPLRDFSWDVLTSARAQSRGVLDARYVQRLLAAQRHEATANNGSRIWALLCFELWCRAYLDGEGYAGTPAPAGERAAAGTLPA